jgi:hypothetical protein
MSTSPLKPRAARAWMLFLSCLIAVTPALACAAGGSGSTTLTIMHHKFIVLLCRAADVTGDPPHDLPYYQTLFTAKTPSLLNVYNYFVDESYGSADIDGTVVKNWLNTSETTASLSGLNRIGLAQHCADDYKGLVHFTDYVSGGIITIWNFDIKGGLDDGTWNPPSQVTEDGVSYRFVNGRFYRSVSFFTHEMLHTFGLQHAHGPAVPDTYVADLKDMIDLGETHTFGSLKWWDYGDCWSIMGCGYWTTPDDPYVEAGPDLGAAQRDVLGWMPKSSIVTYGRSGTQTVTLSPANQTSVAGNLMIKIPIGDAGYYTVEYQTTAKWSAGISARGGMKPSVLIHEVHSDDTSVTYLIGRTIYGTWSPGQVFLDPDNHLRISVDSADETAKVTLSPGGPGDGGIFSCSPYVPIAGVKGFSPTVSIVLPAPLPGPSVLPPGTTFLTGVPLTLHANANDPVLAPSPVPSENIHWQINGSPAGTGAALTHTFATPGDYKISVDVDGRSCLSVSASVTITVVSPSTIR